MAANNLPTFNTQQETPQTTITPKQTNRKKTQPSLLKKKNSTVKGKESSPKTSKILILKEFLARKKLEKESKIINKNNKSSISSADVEVPHLDSPTLQKPADSSQKLNHSSTKTKPNGDADSGDYNG